MKTRDCRFDKQARIRRDRRDPSERIKDFDPVDISLTEPEAIGEAQRCLMGVTCEACEVCIYICPDLCITRNEETGKIEIDLEYCKACGLCARFCPRGAITMVEDQ